jgi:7-cyano-7-deazaguanine reductase
MPRVKGSERLTLLGRSEAKVPASPEKARLETFPNPAQRADRVCVESKSLKFYLASYRNVRAFNEAVTNRILDDFVRACRPRHATITAQFSARGGIALSVRAEFKQSKRTGRNGR